MANETVDNGGRPLKYTITHYRKPEHTDEEFMNRIVGVHLPLALPVLKNTVSLSIPSSVAPSPLFAKATFSFARFPHNSHLTPTTLNIDIRSLGQLTMLANLNGAPKARLEGTRPGWDFADFDCILEYTIPNKDAIAKVMSDPDWQSAVKDQESWLDTSKALLSVGYDTPYLLKTGEVVNLDPK